MGPGGDLNCYNIREQQLLNGDLKITAVDEKDNIMALSHRKFDVKGVQFHPESILTEHGITIVKNWLELWSFAMGKHKRMPEPLAGQS